MIDIFINSIQNLLNKKTIEITERWGGLLINLAKIGIDYY